jgi:hypothetical protein
MKDGRGLTGLFENEVGDVGFEIPEDDRERGQVERGVRKHQHPDPACDREDRSEHEPDDRALFDVGEPLLREVPQSKQSSGEQHDQCLGPHAGSEQLAKAFEEVPPEYGLFSEGRTDNHEVHGSWERGRFPAR